MEKTYSASQNYLIMGPRKLRLVMALVKKMKPMDAIEKLPFVQKRAGAEIAKVIKNAVTSAKNAGVSETDLIIKEIQINEGPRLKRGRAASRGRWHPYVKRMSHIKVVLQTTKSQNSNLKIQNEKTEKTIEVEKTVKTVKKGTKKSGTKS